MTDFLNRFTTLPILLDALVHRRLTLLGPETWEDRNDAYYLEEYKSRRRMKTVLALCFSTKRETFHHWKVFSSRNGGVCIEFNGDALVSSIADDRAFRAEEVRYRTLNQVESARPKLRDLPFLKRHAFMDEGEFRILYRHPEVERKTMDLPFELTWVQKVTLSPWMPETVAESVISVIREIEGCADLRINRSTLVENRRWKTAIEKARANGE